MHTHDVNEKFIDLCKQLEIFSENDIKNLVSCVHLLWLLDNSEKTKEALTFMANLASKASEKYEKSKIKSAILESSFDLENWNPDDKIIQ